MNSYTFMGLDDVEEGEKISSRKKTFIKRVIAYIKTRRQATQVSRNSITRDRAGAHERLVAAYFTESPMYDEKRFRQTFRMARPLFNQIVNAVTNHSAYFQSNPDCAGREGISPLIKCTFAIRQLAYGVNASFLDEYMQISERWSRMSLDHFCQAVMEIYGPEFLRKPTVTDVEKLYRHHEETHGFPGMLESLDCTDWEWVGCPYAFKGQYVRRDHGSNPFILLEAVASQDLWIWHAFFGVAGSNNYINVLYQSPIFNDLKTERAPEIPFVANGVTYPSGYYLVDGIYPELAPLVKTIPEPSNDDHKKKNQAMLFKVDFAKAYDSVRWDFLDDVLRSFGFGSKWRSWISGCLSSAMASVIVNGSPTSEFQFQCGLKQGDPLAPYLFILVMESLHLSSQECGSRSMYKGIEIDNSSYFPPCVNHIVVAEAASKLGCSILKSPFKYLGVSVDLPSYRKQEKQKASKLGCSILKSPFKYLGVSVGSSSYRVRAWEDTLCKLKSRLSKWKAKTLSIGGRLTLLKAVLGATPIYAMSLYRVPKTVLNMMESLRSKFFNGSDGGDKKITWIKWTKVLAAKKNGGLGVSSFFALNRALLFRWVWRFMSKEDSLWFRLSLKARGIDLVSHCKKRVGDSLSTCFWEETWMGDRPLKLMFSRIYALESNKLCTVAEKCHPNTLDQTFRRNIRGGVESHQYMQLQDLIGAISLSNSTDRWVWDLNGNGDFMVKDVRSMIDDIMLPKESDATRWIKCIPIKVNVFAWKVRNDRLATKSNLIHRGISLNSPTCVVCNLSNEDVSHMFFCCDLASLVSRRICRWWNLDWQQGVPRFRMVYHG
ncbi:RNA-directed DNA polymerase, eukaryota [Tanacetum coccineum]